MIDQAVILAGGFGTRLGALTRDTPKPLLPVSGTPFLTLLVDEIRRHGIGDIVISAGFCGDQIAALFADAADVRVLIEPEPLGTGGALRHIHEHLDDRFLFLNGDSWFDINLLDLAGVAPDRDATLAVRAVEDASRYGGVVLLDDRIDAFGVRSTGPGLINGGVAVLSRCVVDRMAPSGAVSIEAEIYPLLAADGELAGRVYNRPFIDIGVPTDYAVAQAFIPAIRRRGAVIFDRDGVLNADVGYAHRPDQIRWIPGAFAAIKAVNDAGLFAFVATNQAGVARGYYGEDEVRALHLWMNRQFAAQGAHIDAFAYSPFHPDGIVEGYDRVSGCRKPGPDMILDLLAAHGVDPDRAVMIGDKPTDMQAAAAAGIEGALFSGGDAALVDLVAPITRRLAVAEPPASHRMVSTA